MGNKASSGLRRKQFAVYTAPNGDSITILNACNKVLPSCEHHVNIKGVDDDDFENDIMTGTDIYRWFNDRNCAIPKHFVYCQQFATDKPRTQHPTMNMHYTSSSVVSLESASSEPLPADFKEQYVD